MGREYYEALRCLPLHFVDDETWVDCFLDRVYASNPKYRPIVYEGGTWTELKDERKGHPFPRERA